jgi:hypothetical protein
MDERRRGKGKVLRSQLRTAAREKFLELRGFSLLSAGRVAPSPEMGALVGVGAQRSFALLARIARAHQRVDSWMLAPPACPHF